MPEAIPARGKHLKTLYIMSKKTILAALAASIAFAFSAKAQTNLQVFYDFGKDRKHVTTTLEGFYGDKWGNTFFFIDYDYGEKVNNEKVSPRGTYFEIARCLNFWQNTKLSPLSLHVEYNGGVYKGYGINHAGLFGLDWFIHGKDFRNTLNVKVLYKYIHYDKPVEGSRPHSKVPLQFTAVWGMQDLFGLKGLRFSGFADFWWERHTVCPSVTGPRQRLPISYSLPSRSSGTMSAGISVSTISMSEARSSFHTISVPERDSGAVLALERSGCSDSLNQVTLIPI